MHPPNMRMANHMNPNVSKPQHAVGAAGINVAPNAGGMMSDWNSGPRFNQPSNPNAMRSPNPNQMMQQNQMQGNQVRLDNDIKKADKHLTLFFVAANDATDARKLPDDSDHAAQCSAKHDPARSGDKRSAKTSSSAATTNTKEQPRARTAATTPSAS